MPDNVKPIVMLLCVAVLAACARTREPLTQRSAPGVSSPVDVRLLMELLGSHREGDFQKFSWSDAFSGMHQKLSREYPFTEWKNISWQSLYDVYHARVLDAEAQNDEFAFYLAVREYLFSIPDPYVRMTLPTAYREANVGGSYGFAVLPVEDGRLMVCRVDPRSPAALAGLEVGAEILEWNGRPAMEVLWETSLLWDDAPSAIQGHALLRKALYMTRGPVGAPASIMFQNPESPTIWITQLVARRDQFSGLQDPMQSRKIITEFDAPLDTKMLDGPLGYIRVHCLAPTLTMPFPARAFRRALERFLQGNARGLILDLRGNSGGDNALLATYAGHFVSESVVFKDLMAYDQRQRAFALQPDARVEVRPRLPHFALPVAVLVDAGTHDNGLGMAAFLQQLPQVTVVGTMAGDGSYALAGGEMALPGGITVYYPIGRWLDGEGNIWIAGAEDQMPRFQPDIVAPITQEYVQAYFVDKRDVVLETAVREVLSVHP